MLLFSTFFWLPKKNAYADILHSNGDTSMSGVFFGTSWIFQRIIMDSDHENEIGTQSFLNIYILLKNTNNYLSKRSTKTEENQEAVHGIADHKCHVFSSTSISRGRSRVFHMLRQWFDQFNTCPAFTYRFILTRMHHGIAKLFSISQSPNGKTWWQDRVRPTRPTAEVDKSSVLNA